MEVQCSWTYSSSCWAQRSCSIVFLLGRHLGGVTGMCLVYLSCSWGEGQGLWLESRYALLPALMKTVNIGFFEAGGEIVLYAEFSLEVELQILSKLVFEPNLFHGIDVMIFFFCFPFFPPYEHKDYCFLPLSFLLWAPSLLWIQEMSFLGVLGWFLMVHDCWKYVPFCLWLLDLRAVLNSSICVKNNLCPAETFFFFARWREARNWHIGSWAMRPRKHWSSLSSSLENTCLILILPIKCKADIGWPCSPRHKLGRKSSGLVLIKWPFLHVRIPSGLAAMETLGLGLKPVLLNGEGRCLLLLR